MAFLPTLDCRYYSSTMTLKSVWYQIISILPGSSVEPCCKIDFSSEWVLANLKLNHVPSDSPGYYWIDPNVGNALDAMQVYCTKPGCSCIDCETPEDSATYQHWPGVKGQSFTRAGHMVRKPCRLSKSTVTSPSPPFPFPAELSRSVWPNSAAPPTECWSHSSVHPPQFALGDGVYRSRRRDFHYPPNHQRKGGTTRPSVE